MSRKTKAFVPDYDMEARSAFAGENDISPCNAGVNRPERAILK